MPLQAYLGGTTLYLGNTMLADKRVDLELTQPVSLIPTASALMFFDGADWDGSSTTLLSRYGNATASLHGVTKIAQYDSLNFTTTSTLTTTGSGGDTTIFQPLTSSIVVIYRSSGSASDAHGRLLNSQLTNWLFGTYGGNTGGGPTEYQYSYYDGTKFVIQSGSYDTDWHMMTLLRHNNTSESIYINDVYKTGSLDSNGGFDGLYVNKGQYTEAPYNERTQGDIGMFAVYERVLTTTEITNIYNTYKNRFSI